MIHKELFNTQYIYSDDNNYGVIDTCIEKGHLIGKTSFDTGEWVFESVRGQADWKTDFRGAPQEA